MVPAEELDEKVYGLARRLAAGAMKSIRWTKQVINIPLRQIAHSQMDLSLSLETQSNLSKDHQEAVSAFTRSGRRSLRGSRTSDGIEVIARLRGVDQPSRHPADQRWRVGGGGSS